MKTEEIQQIIDYAYPKIQSYYGRGKLDYPTIDTSHRNTYALHSGEPEAEGEHSETSIAEYNRGTIYLYLPNITNEEGLIRAIIHEYDDDPTEIEAHKNEEDWAIFSSK